MTTDASVKAATASERRELAEVLDALAPPRWDEPSLCAGWGVRETVAHITMPFRYSTGQFLRGMLTARGNFNRMADRSARADAAMMSVPEQVASLRDNATFEWKPPGGGVVGALSHDVIHGLDITTALGLGRVVPADRLQLVLATVDAKRLKYFGVHLNGVELVADDLDWRFGTGEAVHGRAQDLLLVLCGRALPAGLLTGAPAGRFTRPA